MNQWVIGPLALVAIAGCSSTTTEPPPSTSPTASTAQYASVISRNANDLANSQETLNECSLQITVGRVPEACPIAIETAALRAELLILEFGKLPTPPPTEIASLYDDTLNAATDAQLDAENAMCTDNCSATAWTTAASSMESLNRQIQGWKPYGAL